MSPGRKNSWFGKVDLVVVEDVVLVVVINFVVVVCVFMVLDDVVVLVCPCYGPLFRAREKGTA